MSEIAIVLLLSGFLVWAVARWYLSGPDLSAFDRPAGQHFARDGGPSDEHRAVVASLGKVDALLKGVPRREHVPLLRRYMDELFPEVEGPATFVSVDVDGVKGEWVAMPGSDPSRRVLYIHGGAFMMGSPRSHRRLTAKFADITRGVVLAVDYRLMPEHSRMTGIEDCRRAYRWLLDNGPQGAAPATRVWVAGDSAGGNLTLSLIAWVRDNGLRAPDAAVALSPLTDTSLGSRSWKTNLATDAMLGPLFGRLVRVPRALLLWFSWLQNRIRPRDPVVSPAFGDLSGLPPVLVQASAAEMLHDDARRYVNRAVAAGSPAQLQTWEHMVHVWQIFYPQLAEGREAIEEIRKFLAATER